MAAAEKQNTYNALSRFYTVLQPDKKDISAIYMFALLIGLVQLSLPLGIQTIINFVMAGSVSTSIVVLIILAVTGTFFNGLLQVRQLEIIEKLKQKIFLRYAFEFSNRLPRLNIEQLDDYYLPELVNRFFDTVSLQKGIEKILLDLPAAEGLKRAQLRRGDAQVDPFEQQAVSYHVALRGQFRMMAQSEPERWVLIDATQTADAVEKEIWQVLSGRIKARKELK